MTQPGRDHGMSVAKGDWISFTQAIFEVEAELGVDRAEATRLLRSAVAGGKIATVDDAPSLAPEGIEGPPGRARPALEPAAPKSPQLELWVHLLEEGRWIKIDRADLRRWFATPEVQAVGKCPRIRAHLAKLYPEGVPDPAFAPRKDLRGTLLKMDPGLHPLDRATLQKAIEEYNAGQPHTASSWRYPGGEV